MNGPFTAAESILAGGGTLDLENLTVPGGWIILSGIKTEELSDILESYDRLSLEPAGRWQEAGWVCQVFKK